MNIVLLGAPGSGKGTQAELIVEKYKLYYLQAGKIARSLAKKDARLAKIVNGGGLVPEKEMTAYVFGYLQQNKPDMQNILFEGFPRYIEQYIDLEKLLVSNGTKIDVAISLDVSKEKAVERLSARRVCSKCGEVYNLVTNPPPTENTCKCGGELVQRKDDTSEVIENRFKVYSDNTEKLINFLDSEGKLARVNGELSIEEVHKQVVEAIEKVI